MRLCNVQSPTQKLSRTDEECVAKHDLKKKIPEYIVTPENFTHLLRKGIFGFTNIFAIPTFVAFFFSWWGRDWDGGKHDDVTSSNRYFVMNKVTLNSS